MAEGGDVVQARGRGSQEERESRMRLEWRELIIQHALSNLASSGTHKPLGMNETMAEGHPVHE